jgi:hypothetical protein
MYSVYTVFVWWYCTFGIVSGFLEKTRFKRCVVHQVNVARTHAPVPAAAPMAAVGDALRHVSVLSGRFRATQHKFVLCQMYSVYTVFVW